MAYKLYMNLLALHGATVEDEIIDGDMRKCVRIPLDQNYINVTPRGCVFMKVLMMKARPNKMNSAYKLLLYVPADEYRRMVNNGEKFRQRMLGNAWILEGDSYDWAKNVKGKSLDEILNR